LLFSMCHVAVNWCDKLKFFYILMYCFCVENYIDGDSLSTLTDVELSQLVPEIGLKKKLQKLIGVPGFDKVSFMYMYVQWLLVIHPVHCSAVCAVMLDVTCPFSMHILSSITLLIHSSQSAAHCVVGPGRNMNHISGIFEGSTAANNQFPLLC